MNDDSGVMVDGVLYCCAHHAQADRAERERKERRARALTLPQLRKDDDRSAQRKARGTGAEA